MISVPADAWPLVVGAADEFGGQDWVNDAPAGEANFRLLGGKLPQADFNALDDRFLRRYFEVVAGRLPHDDAALRQMAEALGLTYRVHFDKRPALPAPHALSERLLAELAEDYSPDLVMIGADRVLGPWADEPISREVRRYAASLAAFIPCMDEGGTAVARWSNLEPPTFGCRGVTSRRGPVRRCRVSGGEPGEVRQPRPQDLLGAGRARAGNGT